MGYIPRFVIDAVPNIESTEFHTAIPVTYFSRWSGYVYYGMISDPSNGDSDNDGYSDSLDINSQYSNIHTVALGGGAYDPRIDDPGYIHVHNAPSNPTTGYGGNQSWFGNVAYGNSGVILFIKKAGCGIIAASDVLLYLAYGNSEYEWSDYYDSVMDTYDDFIGITIPSIPPININNSALVSPLFEQMCLLVNGYTSLLFSVSENNKTYLIEMIKTSLSRNNPIILLQFDPVGTLLNYSSENPKLFSYIGGDTGFDRDGLPLRHHYVTITGVYENSINGDVFLRVQSWGGEYYVDFNEFCEFNDNRDLSIGYLFITE